MCWWLTDWEAFGLQVRVIQEMMQNFKMKLESKIKEAELGRQHCTRLAHRFVLPLFVCFCFDFLGDSVDAFLVMLLNLFTATLAVPSLRKWPMKMPEFQIIKAFLPPFAWRCEKISIKMHSVTECICALCCCTLSITLSVFFRMWMSFDLLHVCYMLWFRRRWKT